MLAWWCLHLLFGKFCTCLTCLHLFLIVLACISLQLFVDSSQGPIECLRRLMCALRRVLAKLRTFDEFSPFSNSTRRQALYLNSEVGDFYLKVNFGVNKICRLFTFLSGSIWPVFKSVKTDSTDKNVPLFVKFGPSNCKFRETCQLINKFNDLCRRNIKLI